MEQLHFALEANSHTATLYLRGVLSAAGAVRAFRACAALPHSVYRLRLDCRRVVADDPRAIDVVTALIGDWRESRFGMTHVALPRERRLRDERRYRRWSRAPASSAA